MIPKTILAGVLITILSAGLSTGCNGKSDSKTTGQAALNSQIRGTLDKGIKAFSKQRYHVAEQFFEKAVQLDPSSETARMYLATNYLVQFIPGSSDPKSEEMAQKAIETFKKVVAKPANQTKPNEDAMLAIVGIYYQLQKMDESREWCNKLLKSYPQNSEAYYRIGVIAFDDAFVNTGIRGENVAFLSPKEKLCIRNAVDEGIVSLNKALEIRPDFNDAMEYKSLLLREAAKLAKDQKAKNELIHQSDQLIEKAIVLRKTKREDIKKTAQTDAELLHFTLRYLIMPPPPPPPPPPPHRVSRIG